MIGFIVKRLLSAIALLFIISTIAYLLLFFTAGDVARHLLGADATPEQIELKRQELGLDQPLLVRYLEWLTSALHGDLGRSWITNQPVIEMILGRLPVTMSVIVPAMLITATLAIALGIAAALRRGWIDQLIQGLGVVAFAIPNFLIALLLVTVFAIQLRWVPATGFVPLTTDPGLWVRSIILPVLALAVSAMAASAQQVRGGIITVLEKDFVRTLTSRGLARREVLGAHVLRAASTAALTVLSLQFISLIGGTVVIEQVFALPGMGTLAISSTTAGDLPVVMGVVVTTVILVLVINFIVDLVNGWLIPKARVA